MIAMIRQTITCQTILRFIRNKQGVAGIEFALLVPLLILLFMGSLILALLFRDSKAAERATSVVADVVSRRTTVDSAYLATCSELFRNMVNRKATDVKFRVSSLKKAGGTFTVDWSYGVSMPSLSTADVAKRSFPLASDNDSLVLVETSVEPNPLSSYLGISFGANTNALTDRPRFTAAIVKSDG